MFKPFAWASALADDMLWFQKFRRHPKTRISLMRSFMLFNTLVSVKLTHGIIYKSIFVFAFVDFVCFFLFLCSSNKIVSCQAPQISRFLFSIVVATAISIRMWAEQGQRIFQTLNVITSLRLSHKEPVLSLFLSYLFSLVVAMHTLTKCPIFVSSHRICGSITGSVCRTKNNSIFSVASMPCTLKYSVCDWFLWNFGW